MRGFPKSFVACGLLRGLMFGGMVSIFLLPIPTACFAAYVARRELHFDWSWVAITSVSMAAASVLMGVVQIVLCMLIVKYRVRSLGYVDSDDDA